GSGAISGANQMASTMMRVISISRRFNMPIDKTINQPDDSDIQGPKP
ncbi:uncharacterized protein METZ01_LOCUS117907, partial [marine metagenome]